MNRKISRALTALTLILALFFAAALSGCDPGESGGIAKYAVTFEYNDGSSRPYTVKAAAGESVSAPADPIRTGYDFQGWWTEKESGAAAPLPFIPTAAVTFYAHWSIAVCTAVFDVNGGISDDLPEDYTQEAVYGGTAMFPSQNPSREGHTFIGWYTAQTGGVQVSSPITVRGDATYYAHWSVNRYTVTYNYNYSGAPQSGSATYDYGTEVNKPDDPGRTGYDFSGWRTASSGGTQISFPFTVTNNITMYAHWTAKQYTITFNYNYWTEDPDFAKQPASVLRNAGYGSLAVPPTDPERDDFEFAGWYTAAAGGQAANFNVPVSGDAVYYAQWREKDAVLYTVTLNENCQGGAVQPYRVVQGQPLNVQDPSRTGHTFAGWWTASSGGTQIVFPYTPAGDITLYAHWDIIRYTVTFNYNYSNAPDPASEQLDYGSSVSAPGSPSRAGYNFTGWYTSAEGGQKVDFPYEVLTEINFFAQWKRSEFTLTYNGNAGADAVINLPPPAVSADGYVQRAPGNPRRAGWQFTGWFTEKESGMQIVYPYTTTETAVTVYARWARIQYTFRFRPNFPNAGPIIEGQIIEYGSSYTEAMLPDEPVRPGFEFAGWYTAARPDDGEHITFPYNPSQTSHIAPLTITLYAHWTAQQVVTDIFHAEYTLFSYNDEYKGYSGQVRGVEAVSEDRKNDEGNTLGALIDPNIPREALGIGNSGYYVSYLSTENAKVTYKIYSERAISGVTLYAAVANDHNGAYTFGPAGENAYQFVVNGTALNYGNITFSPNANTFSERLISTTMSLKAGENTVELITANSNALQGGTTSGIGPNVDYIKLVYSGTPGALSYYPVYDNVIGMWGG